VQLADKLEAKRAMEKADWECWKKLEETYLFDLDYDNQEDTR